MRVEQVEAVGFGPFNGTMLELAEGMTVVSGPNEAGKSSWHGALYAAVCGVRRARGRQRVSDEEFERHYRPWGGGPWQVRAVVALADGRRVELHQELSDRTGTAWDLVTGRELTRDILTDQTPDASRWLGLDREAFRSVACVPQTALLQIMQQPEQLAEHLQRAAATAGTDATAAEAIKRIENFVAERVGTDRAYTKPLARARDELRQAQHTQERAEQAHATMARLREEIREASGEKEVAEHRLRCAEAAAARRQAEVAQDLWQQAADLAARYPEPPPSLAADDALAQQVRVAVDGYRARPVIPVLEGPTAADLEAELTGLPLVPSGDLRPAPEVETAYEEVRQARAELDSVKRLQPAVAAMPDGAPVETSELRAVADALSEPLPEAPLAPTGTAPEYDPSAGDRPARRLMPRVAAAAAMTLLLAGVAVAAVARQPLGWVAAAAGVIIGGALIVSVLRDHARHIAALQDRQAAGSAWAARKAAEQRQDAAKRRAADLGLPSDPQTLRELADTVDRARAAAGQRAEWERRYSEASTKVGRSLADLAAALTSRGVTVTDDPEADFRGYQEQCTQRNQQAVKAARWNDLKGRLEGRRQAEGQAAQVVLRRSDADKALREAANSCGLPQADTADPGALAVALGTWLTQRNQALGEREQATGDYAILQNLLEGKTLQELLEEADRLAAVADAAAANLNPAEVAAADPGPDLDETLPLLRDAAQQARDQLTELQTTEQERERGVTSVAAAQEAVAQAASRVAQLERLGQILTRAREFLVQAQGSVHRTIAPRLASAIAPHLATITAGRYTEVRVDPDGLQVRVRPASGAWREAARLSHGTAEQVYLLLRAALAQYLVTTNEPCPLILDDPTAYADADRTTAVLQVLHSISTERQIVIFSHDHTVREWAQRVLVGPRDKLVELQRLAPA